MSLQDWVAENTEEGLSAQDRKLGRDLLYAAAAGGKNVPVVHEIEMAILEERWARGISDLEQAINHTQAEFTAEREHRQRLEQALGDSDTHNAEQIRRSQYRIAELEDRLRQVEVLLDLLHAERRSLAAMAVKSAATLAAYEAGEVTAAVPSVPAETDSRPQDVADRVSRLLMDSHVEDADRLLAAETQRMSPRELLITMGCLRRNDCHREALSLSSMVGQRWSPSLLAQLLAMRADKKNWDLLISWHNTLRNDLARKVREGERRLLQAVAGRQDSDLVELVKRLRGKHLEKISTGMLVTAMRRRNRPDRKALLNALRAAVPVGQIGGALGVVGSLAGALALAKHRRPRS